MTAHPGRMYHEYLCEFWYTTRLNEEQTGIFFTLKGGSVNCDLDADLLREALDLDYFGS